MRVKGRGFSLIELTVAMGALSFIVGIVFVLFSYALNGYKLLDARQGVQADALKARNSLGHDFSLTHYDSVGTAQRTLNNELNGKRRDVMCMLAMSSWNDADRFADTGLPLWDRYLVYYATDDQESGTLVRLELASDPPLEAGRSLRIAPMATTALAGIGAGAPVGFKMVNQQTVLVGLTTFAGQSVDATQTISVTLSSRHLDAYRTGGMKRIDEGMEAVFEFDPLNTSPRL